MSSPANGDGPALAELPSTQAGWRPPVSRLGGLFLAGSLLLMGWVAGNLIHERLRWRGSSVVDFRTDKAMGLWPGVNVTLSGYRIGKVESVKLASDGRVDVRLRIASAYRRLVGPKSRATALQEGLIGDTVVTLSPDIAPPDADGPPAALTVPFKPSSSPADLLSDLAKTRLQLDRTLQAIAAVVEKDLPTVTNQVDGTLGDVRRLASTLERESGATAKATRDTLRLYQQTGTAMGEASSEATEVMKTTSPVLVETLQQISTASATTNQLLKRLAGTFLFDLPDTEPAVAPQQEAVE